MAITKESVESLRSKLDAMPENDSPNRELSKFEAVRLLAASVKTLREKGYSYDEVAKMLAENGVPLTGSTLRSYLTKAAGTGTKQLQRAGKGKRTKAAAPQQGPNDDSPKPKNGASGAIRTAAAEDKPGGADSKASGTFRPRPDTPSI